MKLTGLLAAFLAVAGLAADTLTYTVNGSGQAQIRRCATSAKGAVVIPASIEGHAVVALANDTFNGCKKVTSVTVPASVVTIGDRCFRKCTALAAFTFSDGRADALSVGDNVFEGAKLKKLVLPAKTLLSENAFFDSKITTLEVQDDDPTAFLYNLDDVLSPYTGSGSKLKLRSKIKKLIVPRGCKEAYENQLYQFLEGRKKKNRGTVVAQYPRVWVDASVLGTGASYFKLNGKKIANGTAVKPGTKKLQFVSVAASGYAPEQVTYSVDGTETATYFSNTFTVTMPNGDVTAKGSFVTTADEHAAIDKVATSLAGSKRSYEVGVALAAPFVFGYSNMLKTKTTYSFVGLPSGLTGGIIQTGAATEVGRYGLTGTPKSAINSKEAPIFVTIRGVSGYSRTVALPIDIGNANVVGVTMIADNQYYNPTTHELGVLAGYNYAASKESVSFSVGKGAKVSVDKKSLPPGISLVKGSTSGTYVLAGRPTKPGSYVVTVKVKSGKKTSYARFAYKVYAHPLKGSYRGYVNSHGAGTGSMAMTVDAAGKATVSFTEKSTKTTVKNVYAAIRTGQNWDPRNPLVGQFTFTVKVPKDKKRKISARKLKLAYSSDASSGVDGVAHVRNGPQEAFALVTDDGSWKGASYTVRCYPQYPAAAAAAHALASSTWKRDNASFFAIWAGEGGNNAISGGEASWMTAFYDWKKATVTVKGRLPAGRAVSTTLPMVCPYFLNSDWTIPSPERIYRDIVAAPLVVADADGTFHRIALTVDPSELLCTRDNTDDTGFFRYLSTESYVRFSGKSSYYSNPKGTYGTPVACMGGITAPKLRLSFDTELWSDTPFVHETSVNASLGTIAIDGSAYDYAFDPLTGFWTFSFNVGATKYLFEGVPPSGRDGYYGTVRATVNNKTFSWGAARLIAE